MTSICSSPPNAFYHNSVTTSPTLTSRKSLSQLQKGLVSPGRKPSQKSPSLPVPPHPLPRGHDSTDLAVYAKSLEDETPVSPGFLGTTEVALSHKDSTNTAIATQVASKEISSLVDDGEPQGPFEGPEKLLELWFADSKDEVAGQGLKVVDRQVWEEMLDIVKCKVLSKIEGNDVDAYLLR